MATELTVQQQVTQMKNQVQLMVAKHERSIKLLEQMAINLETLEKSIKPDVTIRIGCPDKSFMCKG